MGQRRERLFAGSSKPMRLGFLGFVVASAGVALDFRIDLPASSIDPDRRLDGPRPNFSMQPTADGPG